MIDQVAQDGPADSGGHLGVEQFRSDELGPSQSGGEGVGGGAILNVSSSAGIGFRAFRAPEYSAAKAGIWSLSASLGGLAEEGIRVNAICPDWVENAGMRRARAEMGEEAWPRMAPPVLVQPPEIAEVVVRILSDDTLAGRVMLCPCGGEWGLVPVDTETPVEPLP